MVPTGINGSRIIIITLGLETVALLKFCNDIKQLTFRSILQDRIETWKNLLVSSILAKKELDNIKILTPKIFIITFWL